MRIGFVTDLHFGPEAYHEGRLRKLTHRAGALATEVVRRMNEEHQPDLFVNLGDDLEDDTRAEDLARYAECQGILQRTNAEVVNVAGNHDTINLSREDLNRSWRREGPLYYAIDRGRYHFVVLHTLEKKDVEIRLFAPQLAWLADDLADTCLETIVLMHHPADEQDFDDSSWFRQHSHLALVKERRELRAILEASQKVRAVFNGHVHRNHCSVIAGIPYVTFQSLVENLDADAPGRPAAAHAIAIIDDDRVTVRVHGNDPARYEVRRADRGMDPGGLRLVRS